MDERISLADSQAATAAFEKKLAGERMLDYERMRDTMKSYGLPAAMAGTRAAEVMMHQRALSTMSGPAKAGYMGLLAMIYGPGIASAIK